MTDPNTVPRVDLLRRLAAIVSLLGLLAAIVVAIVGLFDEPVRLLSAVGLVVLTAVGGWYAVTRRGVARSVGYVIAAGGLVTLVALVATSDQHGKTILVLVPLLAVSVGASRYALSRDRRSVRAAEVPGVPVPAARHGVLLINPRSGGGKAERFRLADEARARGIEPVVLGPGDDLLELAEAAVARGADVLGMAGGDGSQALVASVAMRHDVAHVCIPSGTRNHFALDLGLDRDDVVGALDAFGDDARERRIDLATVNDRVFVNNVSLGVYAKVVQSPDYRDAKRQTAEQLLPDLLGPDATPFPLRFAGPDGEEHSGVPLLLVSNNPYVLTRLAGFGTRARLDTGTLGISAVEVRGAADVAALVAASTAGQLARYRGVLEWSAPSFTIESDEPLEAGIDGEALVLEPPLVLRSLPGALRIRIPAHAPGWSPAAVAAPSAWWTVTALVRAVGGHASPIDEALR